MPAKRPLNVDTDVALRAAKKAWTRCCVDYNNYSLNSERCLQAAFYFHLRTGLQKAGFTIFIEAKVTVPPPLPGKLARGVRPPKNRNIFIDTLVCKGDRIILAIELKYKPKSKASVAGITKDLASLSHIRNQVLDGRMLRVELTRHTASLEENGALRLRVCPDARMLLGIFARTSYVDQLTEQDFWACHPLPESARWAAHKGKKLPPRLGLCLASAKGKVAIPSWMGRPFEALA
jgi:hypothetical protein